jgi:uncharacterized protein
MVTRHNSRTDEAAACLRLLILQPTPFCNIDCDYCYLANRRSKRRMSLETLALVCERILESPFPGRHLEVSWHAGEPLTVPIAWYEEAMGLMAERCSPALQLKHHFQTNGILLDANWAQFFARTRARVGISIDGPAALHDANRRARNGRGTHAAAMRAVQLLNDHGVGFHVLTVLTDRTLDDPEGLFDFYVQSGITEVGFNIEEMGGAHARSSLDRDDVEMRFRDFMRRFFALVWDAPGLLKVREFESAIGMILSDQPAQNEQNRPFAIVSVSHDGMLSTFSPELLDARDARFRGFAFGHVGTHPLSAIGQTPLFVAVDSEIRRGVEACERNCRYFRWCGGGAPSNKLFETGRFDGTETMQCRLSRQALLDEVVAGLEARTAAGSSAQQSRTAAFQLD